MATFEAKPIPGSLCDLGEGTLWDERSECFVWVDVFDGFVKTYFPKSGQIKEHTYKTMVTYVGKRTLGGFVLALGDSIALTDENLMIQREIPLGLDLKVVRTNDGNIDPSGCLWVGGAENIAGSATGDLFKIDKNFNKSIHRRNIHIANGIDWSLDGNMMFYIDSATRKISRYQFNPQTSEIKEELTPIDVSDVIGLPDGMCTDSMGNIWVAFYGCGQVRNYSPEGELLNIVQAPTALTTCASFGGKNLRTLFITSVKDYRSPEFAFDAKNDPYGGMCFEVQLPISGKLDFSFNA
ncbi:putative sugar lactone lactonase YvrE [Actinomycetes bacterium]|nr:putative sugar lactone lactonase YvrE [Actinomycetes bacterium]